MVNFGHLQRGVCAAAAAGSKASSVRVLPRVQTLSAATVVCVCVCVLREAEFNLAAWPLAVAS